MSYYTKKTHKKISTFIPNNFDELLAEANNMTTNCKYAKIIEKSENKCKILFNVKIFGNVNPGQIKSLGIRNDLYEEKNRVVVFLEDCIGYSQTLELNIKQTFFLLVSLLEE